MRESIGELVEKLIPGQLESFCNDLINYMHDREWCEKHGIKYSEVIPNEAAWAYSHDLQRQLLEIN